MKLLTRLVATLTLLGGSINARAATDSGSYRFTPPSPQLAKGLPLAQRVTGGIMLPDPSAHALHVYIVEWEHYPEQAQAAMNALEDVLTTEFEETRKVDAAKANEASDQRSASAEAHKLTFGKGALIGGIGVVLGIVATAWAESKKKQ